MTYLIRNIFTRYKRRQLRNLMRGFRRAIRDQKLVEIRNLETNLALQILQIVFGLTERMIFGSISSKAEIVVRQFLLERYAGPQLRRSLFSALGKRKPDVVCLLPTQWQKILVDKGVPVNRILSSLRWYFEIVIRFGQGLFFISKLITNGLFTSSEKHCKRHAYFHDLQKRNLPQERNGQLGYDICSWYAGWSERNLEIEVIFHDVDGEFLSKIGNLKIEYQKKPYLRLNGVVQTMVFICWAIPSLLLAFVSMLRGHWWNVLLLKEAAKAQVVRLLRNSEIADDYFFHFSRSIYRPMWTYIAEARGARIVCYFYSTYAQPKMSTTEESQLFEWGPSTWPLFLVWDKFQADILRRDLGKETPIRIVGPVHFNDLDQTLPLMPNLTVAVFDIQPHRKSITFGISTIYEYYYYNPNVHRLFIEDIYTVLREVNLSMVVKAKRYIASNVDKNYANILRQLAFKSDVIIASPEISPPRILQACIGSISSPFTSAALYFKNHDYPSVYYDPIGVLQKNDPAAHGVQILSNKNELHMWIKALLNVKLKTNQRTN